MHPKSLTFGVHIIGQEFFFYKKIKNFHFMGVKIAFW